MTDCATKNKFDLQVAEDLKILAQLRESLKYKDPNSIEYLVYCEEIAQKESLLKLAERQADNLQLFNAELYKHGIRYWGFNKSFMVSGEAVHKNRKDEHFIYVPMWAATDHFNLPAGCGNSNQRQLYNDCSLYFGKAHERKIIKIADGTGSFSVYELNEAPFELESNVTYWMTTR